jgi:DCN1-like protein 1/2
LSQITNGFLDPNTDEVDNISVEGTMKYLADLGINMENAEFLVPLEIVQAPALGEITKDGFVDGWKNING